MVELFSEMLESVGHEFMDDFFASCESLLAENGLLVLQVKSKVAELVNYSVVLCMSIANTQEWFIFL